MKAAVSPTFGTPLEIQELCQRQFGPVDIFDAASTPPRSSWPSCHNASPEDMLWLHRGHWAVENEPS